ncbi:MAG: 30S ribosomal protein S20 [Bacteroidetes bacterium]|nr:MAG: 30S ribosomal protein S20 [Bacteroidota bacterium]
MAHHKSAKKRIRQSAKRRLRNRYKKTTMRTMVKRLRAMEDKAQAEEMLPKVVSTIDRVAKANIIHKNTAGHLKSKLTRFVNKLG